MSAIREPKVNEAKARQIVRLLDTAFKTRAGLLSEVDDLVERQIPDSVPPLSREHALFLFYVVPNDHGVKSRSLYARAKTLYAERPEVFEPEQVLVFREDEFSATLKEALPLRYPNNAIKGWLANSAVLIKRYDGDPRKMFRASSDGSDLLRRIREFFGYGQKTGGMLLRAVVGLGFTNVDVDSVSDVLLPVDIHDTRISFRTGLIEDEEGEEGLLEKGYQRYVRSIQRLLTHACEVEGIAWLDVDRALWLIGSRGCVRLRCIECPLQQHCRVGSGTGGRAVESQVKQTSLWTHSCAS